MKRRILAALLISGILLAAAILLAITPSNPSADDDSFPEYVPTMCIPEGVDKNNNRIEDLLEEEVEQKIAEGNGTQLVNVAVLLDTAPASSHVSVFERSGGAGVRGPWRHALNGFAGRIPYIVVSNFAGRCPNLLLVQKNHEYEAVMAYAARQGGPRPYVWDVLGYRGDPQSSIAISDSGIDDTHPSHGSYGDADFSKKVVGWRDDVGAGTTPYDDNGHGSHCAGIAAGSGFYSTDVDGRAVTTWSASFAFDDSGTYVITGFNVTKSGTVTVEMKWSDTGFVQGSVETMYLYYAGYSGKTSEWTQVSSVSTPSKNTIYTINYAVAAGKEGYYHILLEIKHGTFSNGHILIAAHWPYDPPSDGYPAWTGVASDAKLVGLKGLDSTGIGSTVDLVDGIDWAVANRETYHIMVLSMSWGGNSYDSAVDNAVSNAVASGIVCVASAGNDGSGGNLIHSPGSNPYAISVAATSVRDNITDYSSQGGPSEVVSSVVKPDITAPGGSFNYIPILSTDSNDQDADNYYGDFYSNDSAPMQGTSMSAPFIAGCAAVVAQALGGYVSWNYSGDAMALQTKMLLLMTATETYPFVREGEGASTSPTLDRGGKDVHEGYGRVNLDAAVEAAALTYRLGDAASGVFWASPLERKCWARNVYLSEGIEYRFNLSVPSGADYDLYLYNITGDGYGEPVILAKSTTAVVGGFEIITYTPGLSGSYYVVVKRATEDTGSGEFTLTSSSAEAVHLLLTVDPSEATYFEGQELTLTVNVFNKLNPPLESTLTLTVTGPGDYYLFDFERISVAADAVGEFSFSWLVPDVVGTYVVEVCLVPPLLTAYDAVWLEVV